MLVIDPTKQRHRNIRQKNRAQKKSTSQNEAGRKTHRHDTYTGSNNDPRNNIGTPAGINTG